MIPPDIVKILNKNAKKIETFVKKKLQETVSVKAPTRRVVGIRGVYRVATTPAQYQAPPRGVTSALYKGITVQFIVNEMGMKLRVGNLARNYLGFNYPAYHEKHEHKWIKVTLDRIQGELRTFIKDIITKSLK